MQRKLLSLFTLIYILFLITTGCAQRGTLSGGEKDTAAPEILTGESTENLQKNFTKKDIRITFNEWVTVTDVFNQVVVSPPLEHKPKISVKKKTVIFEFDEKEVLKEDATYTINFGESVKDFTEGNAVPNLKYVFSTGDFIDSLQYNGKVVDAYTGAPVEGALVMLYDNLADSVVRNERPFYFGKTSKSGTFQINNIKEGTFKVFALKDIDFNYLFNLENEMIGYLNENISLPDTVSPTPIITMYEQAPDMIRTSTDTSQFGFVKLVFNQPTDNFEVSTFPDLSESNTEIENDSIKFWYNTTQPFDLILSDKNYQDTLNIDNRKKEKFLKNAKLTLSAEMTKSKSFTINPAKELRIQFNHPLVTIKNDSITLLADSLQTEVPTTFEIDPEDKRTIVMRHPWIEGQPYNFTFRPNAVEDIYDLKNDTIPLSYNILPTRMFGNIFLKVDGLDENFDHVIELLFRGEKVVEKAIAVKVPKFEIEWKSLEAGDYTVRILQDRNQNGRWDPGNYDQKTQPEKLFTKGLEKLRSNWDLDAEVTPEF